MVAKLERAMPPFHGADVAAAKVALETAIAKVEAEVALREPTQRATRVPKPASSLAHRSARTCFARSCRHYAGLRPEASAPKRVAKETPGAHGVSAYFHMAKLLYFCSSDLETGR
jgi:hypothetical protein